MQKDNFFEIKGKIISGVFALTTRTFFLQVISFFATFILTILLTPKVFGIFFVVSAFISFLTYFSDIGLAAALIQKKKEPSSDELSTVFTIQQLLVVTIIVVSYYLSPYVAKMYTLDSAGLFLLRALLFSFFLSSLKTIPSVLLERKLEFKLLVIPQILETLFFYLTVIILAFYGYGVMSFAWGALIRGIVGLVSIYFIQPWRMRLKFKRDSIGALVTFGIPFQANSLLALLKDDLMTIFLGKILPFSQVGYIGWAKKWAETPLRLIMDNIIKVTFPAFSRLQDNKEILSRAISKSLFFLSLFIFPATLILVFLIQPMVYIIPKYLKWEPALFSFYFFAFAAIFAAFSSPLVNALNAIGKIKITLVLMVFWTILTWILVPVSIRLFSFNGFSFASFVISFTGILPIIIIKRFVKFSLIKSIYKGFFSSLVMALSILTIRSFGQSMSVLFISLLTGLIVYVLMVVFWMRTEILPYLPKRFLK